MYSLSETTNCGVGRFGQTGVLTWLGRMMVDWLFDKLTFPGASRQLSAHQCSMLWYPWLLPLPYGNKLFHIESEKYISFEKWGTRRAEYNLWIREQILLRGIGLNLP